LRNKEVLNINLADLAELVFQKNENIQSQKLDWDISKQNVFGAQSIFEPDLICSFQMNEVDQKNTVEESVSKGFQDVWKSHTKFYECAIQSLINTGARFSFGFDANKDKNSLTEDQAEYTTHLKANIVQPLLKNAGKQVATSEIRTLSTESEIEHQMYRQQMIQTFFDATISYWDLYLSQEKLKLRKDSVRIAEKILEDTRERVRIGKMAKTELMEADAGVLARKSLKVEAEQEVVWTMNNFRTYFSSSVVSDKNYIIINDTNEIRDIKLSFEDSLKKAFSSRPEYIASQKKIEQENIRISFAENQIWPQLDLKASYSLNGLGTGYEDSIYDAKTSNKENWALGLEITLPMGGGQKNRSELTSSKLKKRQALLQAKAIEVALANTVDSAIQQVHSTSDQINYYQQVVDFNEKLLEVELERLKAGKSNSRLVLEKEEDFINAREAELETRVNYKKALLRLLVAEGVLLKKFGIENEG